MDASMTRRAWWRRGAVPAVYLAVAALMLGPLVLRLGAVVPGAARSDVWNSLWSMWMVSEALWSGELPFHTLLLDFPNGGSLLVADPLGALLAFPVVRTFGVEAAYGLVSWMRLALAGWSAHLLADEVMDSDSSSGRSSWLAGLAVMTAPVLVSGLHNGTSEAVAVAPVGLACWAALRAVRARHWAAILRAGLLLAATTLASGYAAVCAFLFVGCLVLFSPRTAGWRSELYGRGGVLLIGLAGALPLARVISSAASAPGNLVGIKHPAELATVRRSTGPADPLAYFIGGDFRSPDFRTISRYGEDFIHCPYLGWTLLLALAWVLWKRRLELRTTAWLFAAAGLTLVLSLGPVVVHNGFAFIFLDDRAWPLPYLLLERLPGFGSLSLLWRLGLGPILAVAVLVAVGLRECSWRTLAFVACMVLLEAKLLAPTAGLPVYTEARVHSALESLARAPEGAVLNYPVVGGRAYLHEQTTHGHPLAGRLNFPNNSVGRAVWEAARRAATQSDEDGRDTLRQSAQNFGVRYVVVHEDPGASPDMYDDAVQAMLRRFPALDHDGPRSETGPHAAAVTVVQLY